jgi:hypothetical protein
MYGDMHEYACVDKDKVNLLMAESSIDAHAPPIILSDQKV